MNIKFQMDQTPKCKYKIPQALGKNKNMMDSLCKN